MGIRQLVSGFVLLVGFGPTSCASTPPLFDQKLREAEQARRRDDPGATQKAFHDAKRLAKDDEERAEALYREARSHLRAGRDETGLQLLAELCEQYPSSRRAARAWLDRGRKRLDQAQPRLAKAAFQTLIRDYPSSGNALSAAQLIAEIDRSRGIPTSETLLRLRKSTKDPDLDAGLLYFAALAADKEGSRVRALELFGKLIARHPLPKGTYTDEALLRSAMMQKEKHPKRALKLLEILLKNDKSAHIVGSYSRATYLDAYILGARIYRVDLANPTKAEELLRRLLKKHQTSLLTDEALFELAQTLKSKNEDPCAPLIKLKTVAPESPYLVCASLVCDPWPGPTVTHGDRAKCDNWMLRGLPIETRLR